MTSSSDPTAGTVLGEAIFEDPRVSAVRRELRDGCAVGNIRAAALLAAYDELSASALFAAREAGERSERERIVSYLREFKSHPEVLKIADAIAKRDEPDGLT